VLKAENISKYICVSLISILLCFTLTSCGAESAPKVVAIKTAETLYIANIVANLPEIKVKYGDNTEKVISHDNFWFNGEYTYVQDSKIFIKETAPYIFEDDLEIIYRENKQIKTTLHIVKQYVPLESITISMENGEITCKQGESLQLITTFTPINASDKNIVYEILSGNEIADITEDGILSVDENAEIGTEITICVTAGHNGKPENAADDIDTAEITIIVSFPLITKTVTLLKNELDKEYYVQEWLYTSDYDGWQNIDLDFRELFHQGYENVTFEWTISAANVKNGRGTAEPEIQVELYNGSTAKTVYHNPDTGWGTDWEEHTVVFTQGINNILSFNQIRCAFRDRGTDEYWYVDWSAVTIIVS
jgi:hypothetical protein